MDRAEKLKKYRTKKVHKQTGKTGTGLFVTGGIGVLVLGVLLFFSFYHKKEEAVLSYVTKEELASCMSFLQDEAVPASEKNAAAYVTQGQLKELIRNIGLAGTISINGGNERLTREAVMDCYEQVLDYLDLAGAVRKETILVLSWDGKTCRTADGKLKGNTAALGLERFHTYRVYVLDDTILGIKAESEKTGVLRQVQVHAAVDSKSSSKKASESFLSVTYQKQDFEIPCIDQEGIRQLSEATNGATCTLCIKGGTVTKIKEIQNQADASETKKQEEKPLQKLSDTVNVLLLNKGKIFYDQIYLTADSGWTVKKDKKTTAKQPLKVLSVKGLKLKKGSSVLVQPSKASGRLFFTDQDGNPVSKGYYGSFTIYKDTEGYYVVNKVNIEKYLYSVVASEMPASFGVSLADGLLAGCASRTERRRCVNLVLFSCGIIFLLVFLLLQILFP